MKFKKALTIIIAFVLIFALAACENNNAAINEDDVVATVNDKAITKDELDKNVEIYSKINPAWTEDLVLDQLILESILVDNAEKEGLQVTEADIDSEISNLKLYKNTEEEYQQYLKDSGMTEEFLRELIRKEYLINNYIDIQMNKVKPSEEELKKMFDEYKLNEEIKASHILVNTLDEANAVIDRLNKGESFEDLAKELSTDPGSGAEGGDLGYFTYLRMVKPFSEAAFKLNIGEISEPVKSEFGYHIIKVTDKRIDETKTYETEKPMLQEYVTYEKYDELIDNVKKEAEIVKK